MEGPGATEFKEGWMEMYSPNEAFHHVLWCPENLPDSFIAEWEVQNLNPHSGLCIVFFATMGSGGLDIFDKSLPARDGHFKWYIKDRLDGYHISYYANTPKRPDRGTANLRKNNGFKLVQEGKNGIPASSIAVHAVKLIKEGARIRMYVDDRKIIDWTDTEEADPRAPYTTGKFGFRQMKWTHFRYRNLVVREVLPMPEASKSLSDLSVVHPLFRRWASPAGGQSVDRNPPPLMWPIEAGEDVRYEIRLSRDKTFLSGDERYKAENPWAIWLPEGRLESGSWYWQVRSKDSEWGSPHHFVVDAESAPWGAPSAQAFVESVPHYRPRVLVDKPRWEEFRRKSANRVESRRILTLAEAALAEQIPVEDTTILNIQEPTPDKALKIRKDKSKQIGQELYKAISPLCRAYILTGEQRYGDKAIEWALEAARWDPAGVTRINDFGDSRIMLSMALVYDTFNAYLSPLEKKQLREAIRARGTHFYKRFVNTSEARILTNHLWQHILHYFFDTAIAMQGDLPEADNWLRYLYTLFVSRSPVLGDADGAWANGPSYFRMNFETLVDVPMRIKAYTGFDLIAHTPWYQENIYYLLYGVPPGSASTGFADNSHDLPEPRGDYLAYADALSRLTKNPHASWYRDEILRRARTLAPHYQDYWRDDYIEGDYSPLILEDNPMLRWARLKYLYDIESPDAEEPFGLPKSRVFAGSGLLTMHGQPLGQSHDKNLFLAMRSSPFGTFSHMLADQNTFNMVYGGERLFYHTGYKVSMGAPHRVQFYKHTKSHNGILVNGVGQPYATDAYARIETFLDNEFLSYAVGNASKAYQSDQLETDAGLNCFKRHIVMLRPDVVVIYDELEADDPSEWTYTLHSYNKIEVDESQAALSTFNTKGTARVHLWASSPLGLSVTDTYPIMPENWRGIKDADGNLKTYTNNAWHFSAKSAKAKRIRFLGIYEVKPNDASQFVGFSEQLIFEGGRVCVGSWLIEAEMDPKQSARIKISNPIEGIYFVSSGELVTGQGMRFSGKTNTSAKLFEEKGEHGVFHEAGKMIPPCAMEAINALQNPVLD